METHSWRRGTALVATFGLVLAACGTTTPAASSAPSAATSASASASAAPKAQRGAGGDLKILYWQAPTILNPHQATGTKDNDASRLVLEPLAANAADGSFIPVLAQEVPSVQNGDVSKDLTTVTWKLKKDVKWSDGTPFTADDVVFTEKYQCDKASATSTSDRCENLKSVEKVDANTVKVTYKSPQSFFLQWGTATSGAILNAKQYASCVGAAAKSCPADQKPIGTGPYKVRDFKPGDTVLYDLNDNYRDPNKPFFKSVTFKGGGDATAAARAAFQTGDVDYAWNLQVEASLLNGLAKAPDAKAILSTVYGSSVERLMINFSNPSASLGDQRGEPGTKHPFFSDKAVRRALAMATDRSTVAEQLYGGGLTGKATCNILTAPPAVDSKNTAGMDVCKFNVNAANAELDKAGWVKGADGVRAKGGVRLELTYQTTVNPVRQKTQDIMKAAWEKAGFKVNLKSVPADVFFTNVSPDGANHFWADVEMFTNNSDIDPTSYFAAWTSQQAAGKANNWNGNNYNRYQNPDYDKLFEQLKGETDQAKRNDIAIKMNDLLISDVVVIPLINRTFATDGISKQLKGVKTSPWDSEMWNIADWSK